MTNRTLRLGTRRSTLAQAQSLWLANRLRSIHPHLQIELTLIETRGDQITNVPLSAIEGKAFFTAELDTALLESRVDLTVHSLKDLALDRPAGLTLAAIPPRENPRDVILFRGDVAHRLEEGRALRIGTSAPRRLENLPAFLGWALPHNTPELNFVEIRGNVDTRLGRLHQPDDSDRQIDGVVLAFAGLIRLWNDERPDGGRERLTGLLDGIRWMVPPLAECPAAPGQGALAVECRGDDTQLLALLRTLHDEPTARQVRQERAILAHSGGGCHQRFGATCITHPACGDVLYVHGRDMNGQPLSQARWLSLPPTPSGVILAWDGLKERETADPRSMLDELIGATLLGSDAPVFIAHSRALPEGTESDLTGKRVWTSGTASWRRLAERGVWVEGCADALGFEWIKPTLAEPVLQLAPLEDWQILTHAAAVETWSTGQVLATYNLPDEDCRQIPQAEALTHVYWASGSQFRRLHEQLAPTVHHACGPGKTAEQIQAAGIDNLTVFPSADEWRRWVGKNKNEMESD
jgi:hydroxymethylbilane synthase